MINSQGSLTNSRLIERLLAWWRKVSRKGSRPRQKREKATREDRIKRAYEAAAAAEAAGDLEKMRRRSYKLIRLEHYKRAWELRLRAAELGHKSPLPEWDGSDLANRKILIRAYTPRDRIGEELRMARFIAPVVKQAGHCIVLAEPRLVPILRRSFKSIDVRQRGLDDAGAFGEADVAAYYETIALRYARTADELRRSFFALRADPMRVKTLRQRYKKRSSGLLIGIAWGSSNKNKSLPPLESWAALFDWPSASFISLQYGEIECDLARLRDLGGRIIHDPQIDQLVDLDGFAAQVAALDAVVSISNTTIDMAGMLGVPTVHVRDDAASAIWPRFGRSPWYPDMIFLYREGRVWTEVFAEARAHVENIVAAAR
jgi:hypothetical protein